MNIAMLGHKQIPSREGGVEIVVDELSTRLVDLGNDVTCYNRKSKYSSNSKLPKSYTYKGVKVKKVFTIEKRGLAAMSSSFFASLKAAFGKYDVVHVHSEGPAFFCFIPKLFGKKVVVTIHGLDWQREKWGKFASWYIKCGEKHAAKYADEIIVLSQVEKDYFLEKYNRKVSFIPNGVNPPIFQEPNEIKKYGLEKDNYILYLGRIVPEKGEHYLIEAYKKIDTDKKLVIAGPISDTERYGARLKKLAKGDNRIVFIGFVEGQLLEELYSNAYIYCLPTDLEGMPLSLLEAMSYGNCCLTSDIPECKEVIEDKAVTFKKGNIQDLQEKLEYLINHEEIVNQYKKESSDYICSKYNWDDVVKKTLELYE